MNSEHDLVIIGGGPAGLSAAINAASEGLSVCLLEQNTRLGGQAVNSKAIENYGGFVEPITGEDLMGRFVAQAQKFGVHINASVTAERLTMDGDRRTITASNYEQFTASAVLLTVGLAWRRLDAENVGAYMGRGVFHGTPTEVYTDPVGSNVVIVGGANSAAQAALDIARNPSLRVTMLARTPLDTQASAYLVDRIRLAENITVIEGVEVKETIGNGRLAEVVLARKDGTTERLAADYLLIYIGGMPQTLWLDGTLALDEKKFILTGPDLLKGFWHEKGRCPLARETSMPGVFAAGDITLGRAKRIAKAVGDGSEAISSIHTYLGILREAKERAAATSDQKVAK